MDRLEPRHRRKAGSGPPANALIAWVGADPYLREAAATVSYRRALALPLPSHTRAAKAAIAACFALTCGAVLGVTTIISHGRDAALYEYSTPSRQGGAGAPAPDAPPIFQAEAGPDPTPAPIPIRVAPALAERATSRPRTTSIPAATPTAQQRNPDTARDPVTPEGIERPADAPARPSGANAGKPAGAGRPAGAGKLTEPSIRSSRDTMSSSRDTTIDPAKPAVPDRRAVPAIGEGPPKRSTDRPRADVVRERLARAHELLEKFHVESAAPSR